MAFRFRRSIRIAPGLRLNLGKTGVSVSAGAKGASMTLGKRGVYGNIGLVGTGLSLRERLDTPPKQSQSRASQAIEHDSAVKITLSLEDNGAVRAINELGEEVSRKHMQLLWEQSGESVTRWLREQAEEINGDPEALTRIHIKTPSPDTTPVYEKSQFDEQPPATPEKPSVLAEPVDAKAARMPLTAKMFAKKREAFEQAELERREAFASQREEWKRTIDAIDSKHEHDVSLWKAERLKWLDRFKAFKHAEERRAADFSNLVRTDIDTMQVTIDKKLNEIEWPRETQVSYDVSDDNRTIWMDVDLPEIEDLPQRVAELAASGKKLNVKNKAQSKLRGEYALHIHGIVFLLAGTSFAALPGLDEVVVSGYSQRLDMATGKINDDYLLSVRFIRDSFSTIDFRSLEKVDPVKSVELFEHRRNMTSTGILKIIEPIAPE
jgi:hypothetical protein